ncbi:MAG: hypothetical protein UY98_C0008G0018 [Candidatus Kaiserbacteria bacterium GW2011_GWA2_58_9]|uniref:SpoVT-AbrB domain-containing protein n=1 Tax=Candidatus Kaiserbacteria bacterium GW2011_GWA2_58_9 TaxID=1618672 RepID=A0A0G1YW30_9BACT|nr:MAG: hypothetical protein UY98_C0008G0018 [Candidatus Kaiserbacteria bacterium GW2011_GWA2_58_9]
MKYARKLTKSARYSLSLTIPSAIVKKYKWREKQKLALTDAGRGTLIVRDWKRR